MSTEIFAEVKCRAVQLEALHKCDPAPWQSSDILFGTSICTIIKLPLGSTDTLFLFVVQLDNIYRTPPSDSFLRIDSQPFILFSAFLNSWWSFSRHCRCACFNNENVRSSVPWLSNTKRFQFDYNYLSMSSIVRNVEKFSAKKLYHIQILQTYRLFSTRFNLALSPVDIYNITQWQPHMFSVNFVLDLLRVLDLSSCFTSAIDGNERLDI